jgi:putative ABC transport system permease protein
VRQVAPRLRPRWHKVFADLWGNKIRTILVVASVTVGLFAVGMIATIHTILSDDIRASYASVNPENIMVYADNFDDDMVDYVKTVDGVQDAEGLRSFDVMVRTGADQWSRLAIQAIPDFDKMNINRVQVQQGSWPPADKEIAIERTKLGDLYNARPGTVEIKLPSGKIRQMPLAAVVHDQTVGIASTGGGYFMAPMQGYVTTDTLEWLEQPDEYNLLYVTVSVQNDSEAHIRTIANQVTKAIEDNNGLVYNSMVRGTHNHPNAAYVDAMTGVLYVLGALVVFLSGFLITNTLSALLSQQSMQIAIMKTIGARSFQIASIFMALIAVFGVIAFAIALPLSRQGAFSMLAFLSGRINFDVVSYRTVLTAVLLQAVIALIVPQAAGIIPVLRGVRVKVQDALSGSLTESDPQHRGWLDRQILDPRFQTRRRISRPMLISLRNTFRHKGRLVLTLVTLTLGGAIFIATFNVQASMESYIRRLGRYFIADVNLTMDSSYRMSEIKEALRHVAGVTNVEGWAYARSELLTENDKGGDAVQLMGPPVNSELIQPIILKGRWINASDRNAIVLSERFLSAYPNLRVGDTLRMRVNGDKTDWIVVGFFQLAGKSAGFVAYTSYNYLTERIHEPNMASTYRITGDRASRGGRELTLDEQRELAARVEAYLQDRGFSVTEVQSGQSIVTNSAQGLNTLTTFLLIMAFLTAIVGSIGLMGTMSMNVLDRTREIGVLRAIGASDRAVMNMVIVEGMLIGMISWVLGTLLALPISKILSDTIHLAVFDARADFTFTLTGPLYWLGLVILLSILASVIPARSAARLTIREALAYE